MRGLQLTLLAALALAVAVPRAGAYRAAGPPWPGGVVTYYDAAPDQAWALAQAVSAWNHSGARVRFVAAPRNRAAMIVEHSDDPTIRSCQRAEASVGHVRLAHVFIFKRDDSSLYCNRYNGAFFLTHELGHVLGLEHETRVCATMNPSGSLQGGASCGGRKPWLWLCRLLEPDDVAGAVALYGGARKPMPGPGQCPLYPAERPPSPTLEWHADQRAIELHAAGAPLPAYTSFLAARVKGRPTGFGYAVAAGSCPSAAAVAAAPNFAFQANRRWNGVIAVDPAPGRYCYVFWSVDGFGRRSAVLARRIIVVPPKPTA